MTSTHPFFVDQFPLSKIIFLRNLLITVCCILSLNGKQWFLYIYILSLYRKKCLTLSSPEWTVTVCAEAPTGNMSLLSALYLYTRLLCSERSC